MNELLEGLYERSPNWTVDNRKYICTATGNNCAIATKHFTEYAKFVQELSEREDSRGFLCGESNLCLQNNCPVYIKKLMEIKSNSK